MQGDSGGPFTFPAIHLQSNHIQPINNIEISKQHILIGVMSTATGIGINPASLHQPGSKKECGYSTNSVRVSAVREWIDKIISDATICENGLDIGY